MNGLCDLAPSLLACISVDADGVILADRKYDKGEEEEEHCKVMRSQSFSFHHRYYQNTTIDQPIHQPDRERTPSELSNPYYIPSSRRNSRNSAPL